MLRRSLRLFSFAAFACAVVALHAGSAAAQTMSASITLVNDTQNTFTGITGTVSGVWVGSGSTTASGAPAGVLGPGQSMVINTQSNGGILPQGTGGSVTIPQVGTFKWSVPWGWAHGTGQVCSSNVSTASGFTAATLSGGLAGAGQDGCVFSFGLTNGSLAKATSQLVSGQALSRGVSGNDSITSGLFTLELGDDGNLVLWQTILLFGPHPIVSQVEVWASNTNDAAVAIMQADGDFVLYDVYGNAVWSTGTEGHPGAYLTVTGTDLVGDTHYVEVRAPSGAPLWWGK